MGKIKTKAGEKLEKAMDLPSGSLSGGFEIKLQNDKELSIEGCKGVLEYNAQNIVLSLGSQRLSICGEHLEILMFNIETALIEGKIARLELE